jgi:hypothetical protein
MTHQHVAEVDVHTYISNISNRIDSLNQNLWSKIRLPNRKPMIRTLLGIDDGVAFDLLIRTVKKEEEYNRLAGFVTQHLLPFLECNTSVLEKLPNLTTLIDQALAHSPDKGSFVFQRLGAGPIYKGRAEDLIRDIAPHLLPLYDQASRPLTEEETMQCIINERISKVDASGVLEDVQRDRLLAALKCLDFFRNSIDGDSYYDRDNDDSDEYEDPVPDFPSDDEKLCLNKNIPQNHRMTSSKQNGLHCERSLMNFLDDRLNRNELGPPQQVLLLQNVFINYKSTSSRRKYMDTSSLWTSVASDENTGIIWSSNGREGLCSEFDAVILQNTNMDNKSPSTTLDDGPLLRRDTIMGEVTLCEIWEAKHTLSPSTLFDAIAKKGKAIGLLYDDPDAVLWRDIRASSNRFTIIKRQDDQREYSLLFGIYGKEILDPSNAIDLLRVMAVSKILSTDVEVIMKSLDTGYVSVTPFQLKYGLDKLREVLRNLQEQRIGIRIVVECN